jgi:hypothetical protein
MFSITEPGDSTSSSSAARAWRPAGYSVTGGQAPTAGSKLPIAQAPSEIVAIARAIRCGFEHATLNFIGFLHGFETFRQAAGPFAGAAAS